jgi:putative FmdB family regulatory protein
MPIYEYKCMTCGKKQEVLQRHDGPPLTICPECGGHMKKLISNTSFVLKGTGWYKTDYASKSTKSEKAGKTEKTATAEKSGEASSDKTPAAKTETKAEPAAKT